jgi:hypothetical protein
LVEGEEVLRVAPQTAQRVLSSAFFDPQVAQTVVFGAVFSDFLAMGNLLVVSSRIWHYTSTCREVGIRAFYPEIRIIAQILNQVLSYALSRLHSLHVPKVLHQARQQHARFRCGRRLQQTEYLSTFFVQISL